MSINLIEPGAGDLTIQQVARRTGLAESALRYYERIGLIDPVPRDESSGHRRYPPDLVAAIEGMSCLRGTGLSSTDMPVPPTSRRCSPGTPSGCAARSPGCNCASAMFRRKPNYGLPESTATPPRRNGSPRPRSNLGPNC